MVVLATAMIPQTNAATLGQTLGVSYDGYGFYQEVHPKLRPVEVASGGIFLAGACQSPKDIPEAVAMASAAAAKVMVLFSSSELEREPIVAVVNEETCVGCFYCREVCPYNAITEKQIKDRSGKVLRVVAEVNPGLCQGCGTCNATCPSKSVELLGYKDEQIYAQINAFCEDVAR